jgi:hypothetical protein
VHRGREEAGGGGGLIVVSPSQTIGRWFEAHRVASVILPDGWYGRPYDNQHSLTRLTTDGAVVRLVLDGSISLELRTIEKVDVEGHRLSVGPCAEMTFQSPDGQVRKYEDGIITFVAPTV